VFYTGKGCTFITLGPSPGGVNALLVDGCL